MEDGTSSIDESRTGPQETKAEPRDDAIMIEMEDETSRIDESSMESCESRAEPRESTHLERNLAEWKTKHRKSTNEVLIRGRILANRGWNLATNRGRNPGEWRAEHRKSTNRGPDSKTKPRESRPEPRDESRAEPQRMEGGTSRIEESRTEPREWMTEPRVESKAEPHRTEPRESTSRERNLRNGWNFATNRERNFAI